VLYTEEAIKKKKQRADRLKKIFRILTYIIVFPLLIYNIALIVQSVLNPNQTPSFLGIKTYVIISGSMIPEFQIGDIAVVKEVENDELKEGDIISFREGQNVITHRITQKLEENGQTIYVTKGDNNNAEDIAKVSYALIEGKVVAKIAYIGKIALMLKGKVAIIFIFIIYYIIISKERRNKLRKNRRKNKRMIYEESKKQIL